ncbi:MAG: hypothetical protein H6560_04080 [Lewinellaceae bacterium]|nr:hypothetical protein [Lewinellaceae bacterium]
MLRGRTQQAKEQFELAVQMDSNFIDAHYSLVCCWLKCRICLERKPTWAKLPA